MDITRDVMKMVQEEKSVEEMREVIIKRYGNFGPSTDLGKGSNLLPKMSPALELTDMAGEQCSDISATCSQ